MNLYCLRAMFTALRPYSVHTPMYGPGGQVLVFLNGADYVLIWGRRNYLGSEFRDPKCAICGLKFGVGEIIWDLIFLVYRCPSQFLRIKLFFFRN